MTLLHTWLDITAGWREAFCQERTAVRAIRQGLGSLVCLGRRTVTRILWASGRQKQPWQAEYHLFGRAPNGAQRFYAKEKFTPEGVRQDPSVSWKTVKIFYGGQAAQGALQRNQRCVLAGRRSNASPAPVGRRPHALSQTQKQQMLLPPTGLSTLHGPRARPPGPTPNLL